MNSLFSEGLKNVGLSIFIIYASRKAFRFLNENLEKRNYKTLSKFTPLVYLFGLYNAKEYLYLASKSIPLTGFVGWMVDSYVSVFSISFSMTLVTLAIGYPSFYILFTYFRNFVNRLGFDQVKIDEVIQLGETLKISLEKNKNWDIVFKGVSLKTWAKPKPVINDEYLEKVAPLKSSATKSDSKYYDGNCSICCEDLSLKKLHRELNCGHLFHPECVDSWLLSCNSTCPMCRKTIYDTPTEISS
jgi:hypothetical protein